MGQGSSRACNTLVAGGTANITSTQVLKKTLIDKLKEDPCRYRVGVPIQTVQARMWSYPKQYSNKEVYHVMTRGNACLKTWEDEVLSLLPANHPYNTQKISNIQLGSKGFLYIIDMMS